MYASRMRGDSHEIDLIRFQSRVYAGIKRSRFFVTLTRQPAVVSGQKEFYSVDDLDRCQPKNAQHATD